MGSKILYNIASRSRPSQFDELLTNLLKNIHGEYQIAIKVDLDDKELGRYQSIAHFHYEVYELLPCMYYGSSSSKVNAINRNIPTNDWDILVNLSDDQRFIVPGFDNIIRQHMEPDTFLHFPDEMAQGLCTMSIMDRRYYERFNYIYHPSYKSLWCDNEATEVAKLLGRYKYVDQVIFKHYHPAWGLAPTDKLYKRNDFYWNEDKRTYKQRKARNFDLDLNTAQS